MSQQMNNKQTGKSEIDISPEKKIYDLIDS